MKLTDIDVPTYLAAGGEVKRQLSRTKSRRKLLAEARRKVPLIRNLLETIDRLGKMPVTPLTKQALTIIRRELTVLLTLQSIEKGTRRGPDRQRRTTGSRNHH